MEDLYRSDPLDLIDMIMIRLDMIEREASELAVRERSPGKMLAIATQAEAIRDALTVLREKCRQATARPPSQP